MLTTSLRQATSADFSTTQVYFMQEFCQCEKLTPSKLRFALTNRCKLTLRGFVGPLGGSRHRFPR